MEVKGNFKGQLAYTPFASGRIVFMPTQEVVFSDVGFILDYVYFYKRGVEGEERTMENIFALKA